MVATPHTAFGELLRISLEESAQYQVRLVQSAKEARAAAEKAVFQLAVVDTAISDEPFVPFCYDLLEIQPGVRLVIVPPDNNPNHPGLGGLIPHGYLNRPFYLPDLIDVVSRLLSDREKQLRTRSADDPPPAVGEDTSDDPTLNLPPWLQEPLTLQSYLEKELANTEALAGVIGLNGAEPGTGTLRASAGSFSEPAAQELSAVIFRYWNNQEKTDLMRFVRLSSDKKDYLIYATQIAGDLVLILVYDNTAPLSQIRPQTKTLAQALVARPPEDFRGGSRTVFAVETEPVSREEDTPVSEPPDLPDPQDLPDPLANSEPQALEEPPLVQQPPVDTVNVIAPRSNGAHPSSAAGDLPTQPPVAQKQVTNRWEPEEKGSGETPSGSSEPVPAANEPQTEPLDDAFVFNRLNQDAPAETSAPEPEPQPPAPAPVEASAPLPDLTEFEESELETEEDTFDTNIFNLTALLGSVPSPDPDKTARRENPFAADWVFERSGTSPIPTLPGSYNGRDRDDRSDRDDQSGQDAAPDLQTQGIQDRPASLSQGKPAAEETSRIEDTAPVIDHSSNLPQMAPLNPKAVEDTAQRMRIDPDTYPTAPSGRPASMEVNTEPPVKSSILPPVEHALAPSQPLAMEPEEDGLGIPMDDTHPSVVTTLANLNQFEPVSPALSLLNYTCVLVPRLPQHYLTGELADKMAVWVQQLCLAFGWRLEGISVRPEYLQWTVQVAPAVSPGNLVRVIRQRTSQHIFSSFPGLATHNPSGDFWAIGYLIVSGAQPPSAQLLRDYIAQTRKRQGINR